MYIISMHIYAVMHNEQQRVIKRFIRQYNSYFEDNIKSVKMENQLVYIYKAKWAYLVLGM